MWKHKGKNAAWNWRRSVCLNTVFMLEHKSSPAQKLRPHWYEKQSDSDVQSPRQTAMICCFLQDEYRCSHTQNTPAAETLQLCFCMMWVQEQKTTETTRGNLTYICIVFSLHSSRTEPAVTNKSKNKASFFLYSIKYNQATATSCCFLALISRNT